MAPDWRSRASKARSMSQTLDWMSSNCSRIDSTSVLRVRKDCHAMRRWPAALRGASVGACCLAAAACVRWGMMSPAGLALRGGSAPLGAPGVPARRRGHPGADRSTRCASRSSRDGPASTAGNVWRNFSPRDWPELRPSPRPRPSVPAGTSLRDFRWPSHRRNAPR